MISCSNVVMRASAIFLLLCSGLSAVHYGTSTDCQTETYNDLTKVIPALQNGYLLYETDLDIDFVCLIVTKKSATPDNKQMVLEGSFRTIVNKTVISFTQVITVGECPEDFEFVYTNVSDTGDFAGYLNKTYKAEVVYSDYKSCEINTDAWHTSTRSCRLWILNDASDTDIANCIEKFITYCGDTKREVHNDIECGRRP